MVNGYSSRLTSLVDLRQVVEKSYKCHQNDEDACLLVEGGG